MSDLEFAVSELQSELSKKRVILRDLFEFLEGWAHEGRLQTFEDRQRFRSECQAVLGRFLVKDVYPAEAEELAASMRDLEVWLRTLAKAL